MRQQARSCRSYVAAELKQPGGPAESVPAGTTRRVGRGWTSPLGTLDHRGQDVGRVGEMLGRRGVAEGW